MDRFAELKAFCLVATSGGFSPAARQLGVATSSVTRLVDSLERRVGSPLLNRSTRNVTLTDSGRAYFERASAILSALDEADDQAGAPEGAPRGLLRVSAPVTFSALYIAPLLPALARRYPQLVLDMHLSDSVSNMVDEGIDVAIRIGAPERQPQLIARMLAPHPRSICASPAYLAQYGTPQTPAELADHNCLQFSYGAQRQGWRMQLDGEVHEVLVSGSLSVNNSEVLRQTALGGMGLALLPDWLVRRDIDAGLLVRVLERYQSNPGDMNVGIHAVYQANRRGSSKVKAFIDALDAALSTPGAT
jgi:DNA-binding transcriptional LysR family regulator